MRALAPVAIVAIIAVTTLLLVWMARRREARRETLARLSRELPPGISGYDIPALRRLLREYRTATDKEITR